MPRTRHAIITVIAVLAILVGLLIAVRVFAPDEEEFEPLPAAVIFSRAAEDAVYTVMTLPVPDMEAVRESLVEKVEAEGTVYEPEPIAETPVVSPVTESADPYRHATNTQEVEESEAEMETATATATPAESDESADEEAVIEEE